MGFVGYHNYGFTLIIEFTENFQNLFSSGGVQIARWFIGDDQRRVATPAAALDMGSDLLVIGRPLTRAASPSAALTALAAEISARDQS